MTPMPHHSSIAKHVSKAWASKPRVITMSAHGTDVKQPILVLDGHPRQEMVAFSTIGLSDHGGYELAAIASDRNTNFIKIVFDIASFVVDGFRTLEAGVTFEKIVARYYSRSEAHHLLLSRRPIPGLEIPDISIDHGLVRWLYSFPITSDELISIQDSGYGAFEPYLEALGAVDIVDLDRGTLSGVPHFDPWAKGQ